MCYSPAAIEACFRTVEQAVPSAQLAGIYVDKPGYHNCREALPSSDYSVQHLEDRLGDPEAGSALDITLPPNEQRLLTARLIRATLARDPRMWVVREFYGSVDGVTVTGLDVRDLRWLKNTDDSHLWHIHISFYRRYATDHAALQQVAGVLIGVAEPPVGEDMNENDTEKMIAQAFRAYHMGGNSGPFTRKKYPNWIKGKRKGVGDRLRRLEGRHRQRHRRRHKK